jgi:ADP-ribose pyrophosphatase
MAAGSWQPLGDYLSSPGVFTEVVHLFLATQLSPLPPRPEEHEVFEVHWLPFTDVLQMARSGELRDGKSLVGVFRAAAHVAGAA